MQFTTLATILPAGFVGGAAMNIGWYSVSVTRLLFSRLVKRAAFWRKARPEAEATRVINREFDSYYEMIEAAGDVFADSQGELPPAELLFIVPNETDREMLAREMGVRREIIGLPDSETAVSSRQVKRIIVLDTESCLAAWARRYDRGGDLLTMLEKRVAGVAGGVVELHSSPELGGA